MSCWCCRHCSASSHEQLQATSGEIATTQPGSCMHSVVIQTGPQHPSHPSIAEGVISRSALQCYWYWLVGWGMFQPGRSRDSLPKLAERIPVISVCGLSGASTRVLGIIPLCSIVVTKSRGALEEQALILALCPGYADWAHSPFSFSMWWRCHPSIRGLTSIFNCEIHLHRLLLMSGRVTDLLGGQPL